MLSYIDVIPAAGSVSRGGSLNLLGGVANDGDAVTATVRVWGRVADAWQPLAEQQVDLKPHEHRHLYFTLGPDCFDAGRWGEDIEDIELRIDDRPPGPLSRGVIVFVEQP